MSNFGIMMPIGPGDGELTRATDTLESLLTYEPHCGWIVLVDDVPHARDLGQKLPVLSGRQCKVFVNPRGGKGNGWSGGMCVGVAVATRWLARETEIDFAVRLDTDSLVIAPFADKIRKFFQARPNLGLAGTTGKNPDGSLRAPDYWAPMIEPYTHRFRLYKNRFGLPMHPRSALFGRSRRRRLFLRRAILNGYKLGEFCQGGGYAISRALLNHLREDPDFADPLLFRETIICEDLMMGITCRAMGLNMAAFNGDGEPFGVLGRSLPDDPALLRKRGYSIIHTVKSGDGITESDARDFFRSIRNQPNPASV